MIIRYTTSYHNFVLPLVVEEIDKIELIFSQNGENIILKHNGDLGINLINTEELIKNATMNEDFANELNRKTKDLPASSILRYHLTQEESSQFKFYPAAEKDIALAQIRILTKKNESLICRPIKIRIFGGTQEGVL